MVVCCCMRVVIVVMWSMIVVVVWSVKVVVVAMAIRVSMTDHQVCSGFTPKLHELYFCFAFALLKLEIWKFVFEQLKHG